MSPNYSLYSISRINNIRSEIGIFNAKGQRLTSRGIDTVEIEQELKEVSNENNIVIALPINCESDYYDMHIVIPKN